MNAALGKNHAVTPSNSLLASRLTHDAAELPELVSMLCRAFEGDSHINWLIRQDAHRAAAMHDLFRMLLTEMGAELLAAADYKSAALWFPPGGGTSWLAQARFFQRYLRIAGSIRAIKRALDLKRMDQRHPAQPHFYLQLLGVAPEYQRQGHGSELLRHMLMLAETAACPVYLETSSPQNMAFYAQHGFAATAETALSDGLRLWSLLWQPTSHH